MNGAALLGLLAPTVAAAVFTRVGWELTGSTSADRADRLARALFGVWWFGLAAGSALGAATKVLAAAGALTLTSAVAFQLLGLAGVCVSLWALLYYLTYLFTGSSAFLWPLAVGYAAFAGWLLHTVARWDPTAVRVTTWQAALIYASPPAGGEVAVLAALLLGPQMLAAAALYGLASRLPRGGARRRLLIVASGILLWFGSVVAGARGGAEGSETWSAIQQLVGVVVAVAVLAAYRPPAWLRRHLPPLDPSAGERGIAREP